MARKKINVSNSEGYNNALFVQRLVAFLIDVLLISLIASFISAPFVNVEKISALEKKTSELMIQLQSEEISITDYSIQYIDIYYKLARYSGISSIIVIFLNVLYFVVFQVHNKGQTLGKQFVKIRVISENGELSYNQMIFRSFISNFILVDIIMFIFMIFSSKEIYFWATIVFQGLQYIVVFISIIMIMNHKDGRAIHDKIVQTKVLREN